MYIDAACCAAACTWRLISRVTWAKAARPAPSAASVSRDISSRHCRAFVCAVVVDEVGESRAAAAEGEAALPKALPPPSTRRPMSRHSFSMRTACRLFSRSASTSRLYPWSSAIVRCTFSPLDAITAARRSWSRCSPSSSESSPAIPDAPSTAAAASASVRNVPPPPSRRCFANFFCSFACSSMQRTVTSRTPCFDAARSICRRAASSAASSLISSLSCTESRDSIDSISEIFCCRPMRSASCDAPASTVATWRCASADRRAGERSGRRGGAEPTRRSARRDVPRSRGSDAGSPPRKWLCIDMFIDIISISTR